MRRASTPLSRKLHAQHGWPSAEDDSPVPSGQPLLAGVALCVEALLAFSDGDDVRAAASMLALALSTIEDDGELAAACNLLRSNGVVDALCDLLGAVTPTA